MLIISCPHCGPRSEQELVWGGEDGVIRPPASADDRTWTDYLFFRTNTRGLQVEHWCCAAGCGTWFKVARDTATHAVVRVWCFDEAATLQ